MTDLPQEGDGNGVLDRLRRRKVVQWGIAYAAGAWGFLQGLEYVTGTFDWPRQIQQLATIALLVGLPVALVLAWYHGDRGQQRLSRTELAILTLLFLLGGGLFWRYEHAIRQPSASHAPAGTPTIPGTADDADTRPSIAVLPFENRSDEHKDAYFVDGIQDDILTQLSKLSGLKVISRTSVEQFRHTKLPIRTIAAQLGVKNLLEGGVQRAGDRVRINVQLIDAVSDAHLWAEQYDRELTAANVFAIQSEVALSIAHALKTALKPVEQARAQKMPTRNLEAWEAYQFGRQRMATRTVAGLDDAAGYFQQAIDLDPGFAQAYAGLADATWLKADYGGEAREPAVAKATGFLDTALRLDPELVEALTTSAKFAQERREFAAAEAGYRQAIELNPNYATAYQWYSGLLAQQGRDQEALAKARSAVMLDPLSPMPHVYLGILLGGMGRFDEGLAELRKANQIDPLLPAPYSQIGALTAWARGRIADAVPWFEKAVQLDPANPFPVGALAALNLDLMDDVNAQRWLARATKTRAEADYVNQVAAIRNLYLGNASAAVTIAGRSWKLAPQERWSLALLRDADLRAGRTGEARKRYENAFPTFFVEGRPKVIDANFGAAIDLALVLQSAGERQRAERLLEGSEEAIADNPRLGFYGYGLADVQIHALRGDKSKALTGLRDAEKAGWRGPFWRYYRDFDPALDSIRGEPEFKAVFADIERDMARQRAELAARRKDATVATVDAGT